MNRADRRKQAHDEKSGRVEIVRLRGAIARAQLALVSQRKAVAAYLSKVGDGGEPLDFARSVLDRAFGTPFTNEEIAECERLLDLEREWHEKGGET